MNFRQENCQTSATSIKSPSPPSHSANIPLTPSLKKIHTASQNDFSGIEIVYSDLSSYSTSQSLPLLTAAKHINQLCASQKLTILSLAPFQNFEAHTSPLSTRLESAKHWLKISQALGAIYLQIPSQFDTENCIDDEISLLRNLKL